MSQLAYCMFAVSLLGIVTGCTGRQASHEAVAPVEPSTNGLPIRAVAPVILGVVTQGSQSVYCCKLVNKSDSILEIADIQTSCPCTDARLLTSKQLQPSDSAYLQISLNLEKTKDFIGDLHLIVWGYDDHGSDIMRIDAHVCVIPAEELTARPCPDNTDTAGPHD